MFNYSLTMPSFVNGVGAGQYTLPYDYMGSYYNNPNYLQNSLSTYMMQGYNFYNPTFNANESKKAEDSKKEKLEYTPVYAADEIYKNSQESKKDKKSSFGKSLAIGTTILAGALAVTSFVSGARSFNGSTMQYVKHLFSNVGDGVKNFFNNTIGALGKPINNASGNLCSKTKSFWGKAVGWCTSLFK